MLLVVSVRYRRPGHEPTSAVSQGKVHFVQAPPDTPRPVSPMQNGGRQHPRRGTAAFSWMLNGRGACIASITLLVKSLAREGGVQRGGHAVALELRPGIMARARRYRASVGGVFALAESIFSERVSLFPEDLVMARNLLRHACLCKGSFVPTSPVCGRSPWGGGLQLGMFRTDDQISTASNSRHQAPWERVNGSIPAAVFPY